MCTACTLRVRCDVRSYLARRLNAFESLMREEETIAEAKKRRHSQTAGSYTARFSLDREIGRSSRAQTTPGRRRDATLHCEHAGGRTDHAALPTRGDTFGGILRSSMRRARPRLIDEWERRGCDGGFVPQLPKSIVRISRTAPLDPHRQLARASPCTSPWSPTAKTSNDAQTTYNLARGTQRTLGTLLQVRSPTTTCPADRPTTIAHFRAASSAR